MCLDLLSVTASKADYIVASGSLPQVRRQLRHLPVRPGEYEALVTLQDDAGGLIHDRDGTHSAERPALACTRCRN